MAVKSGIFKCEVCGMEISVLKQAGGTLVCCNRPMEFLRANSSDADKEKHIPIVTIVDEGIEVKVGEVEHPMETKHSIKWIELYVDGRRYFRTLKTGDKAKVVFNVKGDVISARAFCNLHGLWMG